MNRELETRYNQMKQTWKNLVNANVELVDENKYLKEEIERLQEENLLLKASEPMSKLAEDYGYKAETERLNNIINEFEEELERESNMKEEDTCLEHNTFIDIRNTLKTVLKRLQELKGSDKE